MEEKKFIQQLLKKYADDSITPKEFDTLLAYLKKSRNPGKLNPLKGLLKKSWAKNPGLDQKVDPKSRDRFFNDLMSTINEGKEQPPSPLIAAKSKDRTWYRVAAVLVLAIISSLVVYLFLYRSSPEVVYQVSQTGSRQKSTIKLSDGTVIKLNTHSKLEYPKTFEGGDIREVFLEGEAFFEVAPNAEIPFLVNTADLTTTVLGTSFNIRAYPAEGEMAVAVATGKVAVVAKNPITKEPSRQLLLNPNEVAHYDPVGLGLSKRTVEDINNLIAWKDGILVFNDKSIGEVAEILNNWYDVKIIVENQPFNACRYRGKFKDPGLQKVLESLKFMYNIEYEFNPEGVTITGGKCSQVNDR